MTNCIRKADVRFMSTVHHAAPMDKSAAMMIQSTVPRHDPKVLATKLSMMGSLKNIDTLHLKLQGNADHHYQGRRRISLYRKTSMMIATTTTMLLLAVVLLLHPTTTTAFQKPAFLSTSARHHQYQPHERRANSNLHQQQRYCTTPSSRLHLQKLPQRDHNNILRDAAAVSKSMQSIAAALMIFGATLTTHPVLPAFAADTTTSTTTAVQASSAPESLLTAPSPPPPTQTSNNNIQDQQDTVIDEVWNLINKYYIDPTFNHQDWEKVKQDALQQAKKYNDNDDDDNDKNTMKIVTTMVNSLGDKYTRVLQKEQYAQIQKFDLIGVGVTLMPNAQKEITIGAPPIEGSSSAKAGLRVGDLVTAVNGMPTRGRNAFDIIDQISEQSSAKTVTFTILRKEGENSLQSVGQDTSSQTFDVTMDRQTLQVKDPVQYKLQENRKDDGIKVGYIRISEFNSLVNAKLQEALKDLRSQGANAYVLDLRANTGGAFQSAVEISGMFLKDRVATYVVDRNQVELPFRTPKMQDLAIDPNTPMVIWLDGMSASASEVLAGSLHDNCRAVTMGDNSFGKGLIQAVYGLKNGAGLVVTVAQYITPGGTEIQGKGIVPDIAGQMPAPVFIPGLSSDTSKVDFNEISKRLDPNMCRVPEDRAPAKPATESIVNSG